MPCDASYMEPTQREKNSKLVARLLIYVLDFLQPDQSDERVDMLNIAQSQYGDPGRLDELTARLCSLCHEMSDDQKNSIIYNGHSPNARRLADWWDEHQEADRQRVERERQELIQSKEYQINSSINVARGRLENDADPNDVINWLEEEIDQIMNGTILYND